MDSPAFGQADLTNCEREPIHLAGSVQSHGLLLVVREADTVVVQASANTQALLRRPTEELLGVKGVCCTPHLGASTPESETNCAVMAAADVLVGGVGAQRLELPRLAPSKSLPRYQRLFTLRWFTLFIKSKIDLYSVICPKDKYEYTKR